MGKDAKIDGEDWHMRIFISYARRDGNYKQILEAAIKSHYPQHEIWTDQSLEQESDLWATILAALHRSDLLLYLVSDNSLTSKNCHHELRVALASEIPIIPVIMRPLQQMGDADQYAENLPDDIWVHFEPVPALDLTLTEQNSEKFSSLWSAIDDVEQQLSAKSPRLSDAATAIEARVKSLTDEGHFEEALQLINSSDELALQRIDQLTMLVRHREATVKLEQLLRVPPDQSYLNWGEETTRWLNQLIAYSTPFNDDEWYSFQDAVDLASTERRYYAEYDHARKLVNERIEAALSLIRQQPKINREILLRYYTDAAAIARRAVGRNPQNPRLRELLRETEQQHERFAEHQSLMTSTAIGEGYAYTLRELQNFQQETPNVPVQLAAYQGRSAGWVDPGQAFEEIQAQAREYIRRKADEYIDLAYKRLREANPHAAQMEIERLDRLIEEGDSEKGASLNQIVPSLIDYERETRLDALKREITDQISAHDRAIALIRAARKNSQTDTVTAQQQYQDALKLFPAIDQTDEAQELREHLAYTVVALLQERIAQSREALATMRMLKLDPIPIKLFDALRGEPLVAPLLRELESLQEQLVDQQRTLEHVQVEIQKINSLMESGELRPLSAIERLDALEQSFRPELVTVLPEYRLAQRTAGKRLEFERYVEQILKQVERIDIGEDDVLNPDYTAVETSPEFGSLSAELKSRYLEAKPRLALYVRFLSGIVAIERRVADGELIAAIELYQSQMPPDDETSSLLPRLQRLQTSIADLMQTQMDSELTLIRSQYNQGQLDIADKKVAEVIDRYAKLVAKNAR